MNEITKEEINNSQKIVIGICGDPDCGKSIIAEYFRKMLDIRDREFVPANVDGEGTVGDASNQEFINHIKRRGEFGPGIVSKAHTIITHTESPIVIVDIGGLACLENAQILSCCDYCIIVNKDEDGKERWKSFIESLQPGKTVHYVERKGIRLKENELPPNNSKIVKKAGIDYAVFDVQLCKKYEEISLGGKSPEILAEIDSRRLSDNLDLKNRYWYENGRYRATLLDLQHGHSNEISSKIYFEGSNVEVNLAVEPKTNKPLYFTTVTLLLYSMLSKILDKHPIPKEKEPRMDESTFKIFINHISGIKTYLAQLDGVIKRIKDDEDNTIGESFDHQTYWSTIYNQCRNNIKKSLLACKPFFTRLYHLGYNDVIDFYKMAYILNGSQYIQEEDLKKLILLYDILLDDSKRDCIAIYGSRLLLSTGAIVEEAKKDGIENINIHSSAYNMYIPCQQLKKSNTIANGSKNNGIRYFYEKNEETKTIFIHMMFDATLLPKDLSDIVLPDVPEDYKIYFSGIIPDWFMGSLSYSYSNTEKAILKPDLSQKCLITYASENVINIGLRELNPPGIDMNAFFSKIPDAEHTFVEQEDDALSEGTNYEAPEF